MGLGLLGLARCEDFGDGGRHYLRQQMLWAALGMMAMLAATLPSYRRLCHWSYAIFGLAVLLLVAVYFFRPVNGAHRWVRWGHVGLQPSEFAKVAFVLVLGRYLMYRENYRRLRGLLVPLALTDPARAAGAERARPGNGVRLPAGVVRHVAGGRGPAGRLAARADGGRGALAVVLDANESLSEVADQGAFESARPGPKAVGRRLPVVPSPQDDGLGRTLGKFFLRPGNRTGATTWPCTTCRRTTPTSYSACWANASACRAWPWCCCFTD